MSEKTEYLSEGGEAIAKAVHSLRDIGADANENVDVRSETHNGIEIKLTGESGNHINFEQSEMKRYVDSDELVDDIRAEFKRLEDDE